MRSRETLFYSWRDKLLEGGRETLAGKEERTGERELRRKIRQLERALGRKTTSSRSRESIARLGVSERVARSRELVARGFAAAAVARVLQVSRQAIYRVPSRERRRSAGRSPIRKTSRSSRSRRTTPTDGYRMVTAWARCRLGAAVNRKRVLRVIREQRLIQRRRSVPRRRRPGFFLVERPAHCGLWT